MKVLREPLFHFVVLGAALFLVYQLGTDSVSSDAARRIEIDASEIELLADGFERRWRRPPTEQELHALVESRVREEVLYREALAVGLDRNDIVVRRRMVQKMEMFSQDLALLADPTDAELQAFFAENREDFRIPPRISFTHVYFNADRRGPATVEVARRVLAELRAQAPPPGRAPDRGDRFMLQHDYFLRTPLEVGRHFGRAFAEELFEMEPGWQGPIASGYGIHLVNIGERVESRIPEYEEIRDRLLTDYNRVRSDRAKDALYDSLAGRYEVVIEDRALRTLPTTPAVDGRGGS